MNAPFNAKQAERDAALLTFWRDGSADTLGYMEFPPSPKRTAPDELSWQPDYTEPHWYACHKLEGVEVEGWGATADAALADMMRAAADAYEREAYFRREEA